MTWLKSFHNHFFCPLFSGIIPDSIIEAAISTIVYLVSTYLIPSTSLDLLLSSLIILPHRGKRPLASLLQQLKHLTAQ